LYAAQEACSLHSSRCPAACGFGCSSPKTDILCALIVPVRFQFPTMFRPTVLLRVNVSRLPRKTALVMFQAIVV
jgi:hypothetical protein